MSDLDSRRSPWVRSSGWGPTHEPRGRNEKLRRSAMRRAHARRAFTTATIAVVAIALLPTAPQARTQPKLTASSCAYADYERSTGKLAAAEAKYLALLKL